MNSSEIKSLAYGCKPACENWNKLMEAFNTSGDAKFSETFDCGKNENGISFIGSFQSFKRGTLARLTPCEKELGSKGGLQSMRKHTNLISERWYK